MNDLYLKNGISAYNKAAAKMPQASNVVVLYDGVLRHLSDARKAFENHHHGDMMRSISKANGILLGLQQVLRADLSQPLFDKLDSFYGSSIIRISQQPQKKFEDNQFRSLLSAVRNVRDAWAEVAGKSPRSGLKNTAPALNPQSPNVRIMG
ncbi:flagellar export chaperone FliS [Terasakiella sp.]|uniref:flagellar export chaperone FliS n=1 Tax=Terasakiella sp. TaxID=2034861 RepID=UPI003AA83BD5